MIKAHFHSIERNTNPLELIHTDNGDLRFMQTRGEKKYYITFIDDCTRYCYVYLSKSKEEALDALKNYKIEVENQLDKQIKIVCIDGVGKNGALFDEFCSSLGTIYQTTAPYSPQTNEIVERKQ